MCFIITVCLSSYLSRCLSLTDWLTVVLPENVTSALGFAVVLLVASIPIALEIVITTTLAIGARELALQATHTVTTIIYIHRSHAVLLLFLHLLLCVHILINNDSNNNDIGVVTDDDFDDCW